MKILWRALLCNICCFFDLSSSFNFGSEPLWKIHQNIEEILKPLKPIVDSIVHTNGASDDSFTMWLKQLLHSIFECRILFENWHPQTSRVYFVLKAEVLTTGVQAYVLEFFRLLKESCHCLPAELSSTSLERCIQKVNDTVSESTATIIGKTIKDQADGLAPTLERWLKIAHRLGLRSNLDILVETIALEKLKSAKQAEKSDEVDYIEQLIVLFTYMRDHLSMLSKSRSCVTIPDDFCCPLCLELMRDPVIVASGCTYERASIKKWFDLGITVCPKTRQTLDHTKMIPDYNRMSLISNWCGEKGVELADLVKSVTEQLPLFFRPDLLETKTEVQKLIEELKSDEIQDLRETTARLLQYAKQNMDNRILIADSGGIRPLVNLCWSNDTNIQENAVTTLLYMAVNYDNKVAISDVDAIRVLIHVLEMGTPGAQANAAATIFCLSMVNTNKFSVVRSTAISALIELLRKGTPQGKNNAAIALFNLSICHENRVRIVNDGAVRFLIELVNDPVAGMVDKAVAVLESVSRIPEGRLAISQAGGIPTLVNVLELGCARAKENAASSLLRLCVYSSRLCDMMLQEGAVPPLVALSVSGTPRAREKARALLSYVKRSVE